MDAQGKVTVKHATAIPPTPQSPHPAHGKRFCRHPIQYHPNSTNHLTISNRPRFFAAEIKSEFGETPASPDDKLRSPTHSHSFDPMGHCSGHVDRSERACPGLCESPQKRLFARSGTVPTGRRSCNRGANLHPPDSPRSSPYRRDRGLGFLFKSRSHRKAPGPIGSPIPGRRDPGAGSSHRTGSLNLASPC